MPRCSGPFTPTSDLRGVSSISIMVMKPTKSPLLMPVLIAMTITSATAMAVAVWVIGITAALATVMRCEKPRSASLRCSKRSRS